VNCDRSFIFARPELVKSSLFVCFDMVENGSPVLKKMHYVYQETPHGKFKIRTVNTLAQVHTIWARYLRESITCRNPQVFCSLLIIFSLLGAI
jgi:hypothetical protein